MAHVEWEIHGKEFANCNCAYGCPCQFNALPTNDNCEAVAFFEIEKGHFGETSLDGLRAAAIYHWPGPVHEGQGSCQIVIGENADESQREALFKIMTGQETEPGATMWYVYNSTVDKLYQPIFAPIELDIDVAGRKAKCRVEGLIECEGGPIVNPITGDEHRARIDLPNGFEYSLAEIGRGWSKTHGPIVLHLDDSYGQFAHLDLCQSGVLR